MQGRQMRPSLMTRTWLACVFVMTLARPAIVVAACTLGVTDVTFGDYSIFEPLDTNITGSIHVSCDSDTTLQVALGAGNGTLASRHMLNGASTLLYNLFLDSTRLTLWGDGSPGTSVLGLSGLGGI